MVKLPLDRCKIVKDVGVIELQVVQHGRAGPVVHELAALVEEGGVVFVGFNHEQGPCGRCCSLAPLGGELAPDLIRGLG